jgi:hypothetical protein
LDKNEIAALLESLCERPFAGGRDGEPPARPALPGDAARALADAPEEQSESRPAESPAALASILSGTATAAQRHGFHEAAIASGALRLEAQSALAFVDGIEQAPLKAPADLVERVLAPPGSAASAARPGIWSRLAHIRLGGRRGQVAAACAVMLMAGGLSWSLLWRPAELADHAPLPMATSPKAAAPSNAVEPKPAPPPTVMRSLEVTPGPEASPGPTVLPLSAPPLAVSPLPAPAPVPAATPAPPAQALVDPCAPRSLTTAEGAARSIVEPKAAKSAPSPPSRTAAVSASDPGCVPNGGTFEADRNPQADHGPVRAAKPAAKTGRPDGGPAATAASAPAAARPAAPAKRPSEFEQRR